MVLDNINTRLSIVIPVYNGAQYVQRCLDNLDRQTFKDWQAVFVNDGSTDNSKEQLDTLAAVHEKCRIIHKQNGGTAHTRNAGLDTVNSQYVTFMDVDDDLDPYMYEKLVRLMDDTNADMGICGYYFKVEQGDGDDEKNIYLEPKNYPSCVLNGRDAIREKLIDLWDKDVLHNVWNKIYRMDFIRENRIRYRDGHVYTEDRVFNRACIEQCNCIAITDECLYYYVRERAGSTSERYRKENFEIRRKEYKELQDHFHTMDVWNEKSREYVSREFMERVAGCIENIFHADDTLTEKEKKHAIAYILTRDDVMEAAKYAEYKSFKMKILAAPIRWRCVWMTYWIYKSVYKIRKQNPVLFHKLKSKR